MKLGPAAQAGGFRLTVFEETASTQADALEAARSGEPGNHWFAARRQSAGRGRGGRPWHSPPGNLHATLLLIDACPPRHAAKLGFAAGLALLQAAEACVPGVKGLALKWPNDLLLDGAKCAGLLVEGSTLSGGRHAAAIGFGVNIAAHPPATPYPARHLAADAPGLTAEAFFAALSDAFAETLGRFDRGEGYAAIRAEWLSRAFGIGKPLRARLLEGEKQGIFEGLDNEGRLMLRTARGLELIAAGDVFFTG